MSSGVIFAIILYSILIINFIAAVVILFAERRDVSATWAWLMILFFLPVLGFVLYLFLGRSMKQKNFYHVSEEVQSFREKQLTQPIDTLPIKVPPEYNKLVNANRTSGALLSEASDLRVLFDGHQKFETLLSDIEEAQIEINIQYFI